MWSVFGCFSCAEKVTTGQVVPEMSSAELIQGLDAELAINSSVDKIEDNQSFISKTTLTYYTSDTIWGNGDEDEEISRKVENILGKNIAERKAIEAEFIKQNLTRNTTIYLIDRKWSEQYTSFLKNTTKVSMPEINNSHLLDQHGELKVGLREKNDYFVVTEKVWKFLNKLYGGGPAIQKDSTFPTVALVTKKMSLYPTGIENPLNQCFIICIVQMLMSIEQFNSFILRKLFINESENRKRSMHNLYYKLLKKYSETVDNGSVSINEFSAAFSNKFDPEQQHDAHEFLLNLMETLQDEMKLQKSIKENLPNNPDSHYANYFKQHKSMIDKIFAGQQETIITCLSCGHLSKSYTPFLEIVLPIQEMDNLEACLNSYYKCEKLDDLYDCQNCKRMTNATKEIRISKCPNYLLVVLAKFCPRTMNKIENRIEYKSKINISKHCIGHCGDTAYQLSSIVVHKGSKSNKGHYYTMTRREQEWFYCNDKIAREIGEKDAIGRDPYILLYERTRI